jgi:hypothetical protein
VSLDGDFWADACLSFGDTDASGQRLPLFRALEKLLVRVDTGQASDLPGRRAYRWRACEG